LAFSPTVAKAPLEELLENAWVRRTVRLDEAYRRRLQIRREQQSIAAGAFHAGGGAITYLVSARKP